MKTKQVNPMPAFVGIDFDCEFLNAYFCVELISPLFMVNNFHLGYSIIDGTMQYGKYRPRLNKPQVLDDWGWLDNPLLDGFVWGVRWFNEIAGMLYTETVNSKKCFEIATHDLHDFLQAEIKGIKKGSQLEDWAKANDVPIYNDDMEVTLECIKK